MGTVKSVDAKANRIVVVDADGAEFSVSLNPKTRLFVQRKFAGQPNGDETVMDTLPTRPVRRARRTPPVKTAAISDINVGDWVVICPFATDTKIIEVRTIEVHPKN